MKRFVSFIVIVLYQLLMEGKTDARRHISTTNHKKSSLS